MAKNKQNNNANIGFEKQLWDAACVLWGHIPAAEYRKVIVGLIFLRYISSVFDKKYQKLAVEDIDFLEEPLAYLEDGIFFVPPQSRWNVISQSAHTPEIGKVIDDAMIAIEKHNKTLKGVLPKNYGSPDLDKRVLGEVVDLFTNNIKMDDTEESKDLLGVKIPLLQIPVSPGRCISAIIETAIVNIKGKAGGYNAVESLIKNFKSDNTTVYF